MKQLLLMLTICLFSCNKRNNNPQFANTKNNLKDSTKRNALEQPAADDTSKTLNKNNALSYDTLETYTLKNKSIVFYVFSQQEFDSIINKATHPVELNDSIADFDSYASVMINQLADSEIQAARTQERYFKINTQSGQLIFDRKKNNKYFGVILSDGDKEPIIREGIIYTDEDYLELIKSYFNIELPKKH